MHYTTALIQLPLIRETPKERVKSPADVFRFCADMQDLAQETFQALTVNTRNGLINRHLITVGIANACLVHAREVFRAAINENAAAIILAHNHPSGDPSPSAEDVKITKQLIDAGHIIGINLQDHVIIGRGTEPGQQYYSLRETGICQFS